MEMNTTEAEASPTPDVPDTGSIPPAAPPPAEEEVEEECVSALQLVGGQFGLLF